MSETRPRQREPLMDRAYFDEKVDRSLSTLARYQEIVDDAATEAAHRTQLRYTIYRQRLQLLILQYSRGDEIDALRAEFPGIVDALDAYHAEPLHEPPDFYFIDTYVHALWLVSLAIVLEAPPACFDRVVQILDNQERDAIYDRLVALRRVGVTLSSALLFPQPYRHLLDALDASGEERGGHIHRFLDEYYDGMKNTYWHDTHVRRDIGFFGYWCFELAAFVKCLGIDDSSFSDRRFYPADLASASWPPSPKRTSCPAARS
jgi:hypothetical protein